MQHYARTQKILFQHCDPAGIVFYPRYFEMINVTVESWFDEELDVSFSALHLERELAVPTVTIQSDFVAPSHLGDVLTMTLEVEKLGGSSMEIAVNASCADELRLRCKLTLVCVDKQTIRPIRWPEDIRNRVAEIMKETP